MRIRKNTFQLAYGGITAAILMLMMIMLRLLPTADLFINFLMSLCMCIAVIELGKRASLLLYFTVALLSFAWPGLPANLGFILVGGLFPYIKIISEQESMGRRFGRTVSFIGKLGLGLLLGAIYVFVITKVFLPLPILDRIMALPLAKLWIIPVLLFSIFLYDFLLSQGVDFYFQRLQPHLKKRNLH